MNEAKLRAITANIRAASTLVERGEGPALIGTVSGSAAAQTYWGATLGRAKARLGADHAISLHEDLPVNQAFGLLLMWQRLKERFQPTKGALIAFVFGEGSRATPLTEAECGQKPALASFARAPSGHRLSVVELALRHFAPVEAYLRRSGFDGVVVKWGDEVQIPTLDLSGTDPRLADADIVRFVSMREMTESDAANKDWVGVDQNGTIKAFIPRRPLSEMATLADRGLLIRRGDRLVGGVNLGSIAIGRYLLDALLDEFRAEVNDPQADRSARPDLDPQLFTALIIAAIPESEDRNATWRWARESNAAIESLATRLPDVLPRLRRVIERLETARGRPARMLALDFGDQYWGDIGQHRQMYEVIMALRDPGPEGEVARSVAELKVQPDDQGNFITAGTELGPTVEVRGSVLIDAHIAHGQVENAVLIGTRARSVYAREAFDIGSQVLSLSLSKRSGSYKVIGAGDFRAESGERITVVFFDEGERGLLLRVHEDTDLRDRARNYDTPILGNEISFADAHQRAVSSDPIEVESRREEAQEQVLGILGRSE